MKLRKKIEDSIYNALKRYYRARNWWKELKSDADLEVGEENARYLLEADMIAHPEHYEETPQDLQPSFESTLTKKFDAVKFKADTYKFALEHDIYFVSHHVFHALAVQLSDVYKYLEHHNIKPDALHKSITKEFLDEAYDGAYDKYHPDLKKEAYKRQQEKQRHQSDPGIFPEPEDVKINRAYPQHTPILKTAFDTHTDESDLMTEFKREARVSPSHSKHLSMIADAKKITGQETTQLEFFKSIVRTGGRLGYYPSIYTYVDILKRGSNDQLIFNNELI